MSRILITGGTGFVGSELCGHLTGHQVRLLVRSPDQIRTYDSDLIQGDIFMAEALAKAMEGIDMVIHLVAVIEEHGTNTFDRVIRQGTANVVKVAKSANVGRIIHMSAMGARADSAYPYLNAKWQAEQVVRESGIPYTIFRPSVIFGPGDGFINVLADLVRKAPILPVIGSGDSKFQPIGVGDVADAFVRAINDPAAANGQTFELGGGATYTYEQMLDVISRELGKSPRKIHLPVGLMKAVVSLSRPLPKSFRPPVTSEQLNMLSLDNCTDSSATRELIGRDPVALQDGIAYIRG